MLGLLWACGEYCPKVQQPAEMPVDSEGCLGTVTCGNRRGWTCLCRFRSHRSVSDLGVHEIGYAAR